ncbi:MAG: S49 family peptidase [Desulfohalobiaceae bacterium]|nr:S49 family peptidase [Desulfohalobiaceae bacterium]
MIPEFYGYSWGITQEGLERIMVQAEDVDRAQALLSKPGEAMRNTGLVRMRGDVAILDIIGPIFHYDNILTWILGWPSAEQVALDLQKALDNPAASSIVLNIDSPGGQAGGINELAGMIREAGKKKPVQSYIGDLGASAAYWLASAASKITVDATAQVGSIGVVFGLRRRKDNILEVVNTESPDKRPDLNSEEGIQLIRRRADALAEVFISSVMADRGLTREHVTRHRGGILVGQAAVDAKLADQVGSMEGLLLGKGQTQGSMNSVTTTTIQESPLTADAQSRAGRVKSDGRQEVPAGGFGQTESPLFVNAQQRGPDESDQQFGPKCKTTSKSPLTKNAQERRAAWK